MTIGIILRAIMCIAPIIAIKLLSEHDRDMITVHGKLYIAGDAIKPNNKEVIGIMIFMVINAYATQIIYKISVIELSLIAYMCIMAYTDERITQLYDAVSCIEIMIVMAYSIYEVNKYGRIVGVGVQNKGILILIGVELIMVSLGLFGMGDVIMTITISLVYINVYENATIKLLVMMVIGFGALIIENLIRRHTIKGSAPLALGMATANIIGIYITNRM